MTVSSVLPLTEGEVSEARAAKVDSRTAGGWIRALPLISGGAVCAICRGNLLFDPFVGAAQPLFETYLRFPAEHLAQARIVGIAPAHTLRTRNVLLHDVDAGDRGDHIRELVDGDQAILAEVEW